jgi:hypothetical protein
LILLAPLFIYKIIMLLTSPQEYFSNFVLVVVIYGAGLQMLALAWGNIEKDLSQRTPLVLALVAVAAITLTLPLLGEILQLDTRYVSVVVFSICSAALAWRMEQPKGMAALFAVAIPILFMLIVASKVGWIPSFSGNVVLTFIILAVMTVGVFVSKSNGVLRTYIIVSLASYLIEN